MSYQLTGYIAQTLYDQFENNGNFLCHQLCLKERKTLYFLYFRLSIDTYPMVSNFDSKMTFSKCLGAMKHIKVL